jgi:hypothetical protein
MPQHADAFCHEQRVSWALKRLVQALPFLRYLGTKREASAPCMSKPTVLFALCVQVNEGNIILYGIAPTAETTSNLTSGIVCNPSGTLAVAATMTCTGTFNFSQAAFEAGSKIFEAALESANLTVAAVSNAVNTTPIEVPSVTVSILFDTCDPPEDAG